jgi:hypothetical protein
MPSSLIVVTFASRVLMVFDRWRKHWSFLAGLPV